MFDIDMFFLCELVLQYILYFYLIFLIKYMDI